MGKKIQYQVSYHMCFRCQDATTLIKGLGSHLYTETCDFCGAKGVTTKKVTNVPKPNSGSQQSST